MPRPAVLLVALLAATPLLADDWPQWMGPGRDNVWKTDAELASFPEGGPKVLWRTPVADGYAGPAVVGDRVYVMDFVSEGDTNDSNFGGTKLPGTERVHALDAATGKILWTHEDEQTYGMSYPNGPRCTPLVADGKVYTLGGEGLLHCFEAETGEVVWDLELKDRYDSKAPLWGFSAHLVLDGDRLLTLAGDNGPHVVALDKATGEELWRTDVSKQSGYSPPTFMTIGGERQLVTARPDKFAAVDPETGEELWSVPYEATNGSIIMQPLQSGDLVFIGGYEGKNLVLDFSEGPRSPKEVFRDKNRAALSPVNVQPMVAGGDIYGTSGDGKLYRVDFETGERLWETAAVIGSRRGEATGTAFFVRVNDTDKYVFFTEKGELVLGTVTADGFTEVDRAKLLEPTNTAFGREVVWSMPAFAGTKAYLRNSKEIIAVDLAP